MRRAGRKTGKYTQLHRVLRALDLLRARHFGMRLDALAEELGVSERQTRRDLEALDAAGHVVEVTRVEGRSVACLREATVPRIALSERERYALLAMRRVFDVLEGTPLAADVQRISEKVAATLPATARRPSEGAFIFVPDGGTKDYGGHQDVIDELLTAVLHRKRVRATYVPRSGRKRRVELCPYALALYRHGLYVVGLVERGFEVVEVRTLAVERFTKAERRRKDGFEVPESFRIDDYFDGAFGVFTGGEPVEVVVDFAAPVADIVRARTWHPSQRLRGLASGGVRVRMTVRNTTELVPWLVGWGPQVAVKEPAWLAESVRDEHRLALESD